MFSYTERKLKIQNQTMQYKPGEIKIFDIETNNLLEPMIDHRKFPYRLHSHARLWCISIRDGITGEDVVAVKEEITKEWMKEQLKDCKILVAHNGHKFDLVALRLFGVLDYKIGYPGQSDKLFGRDCKILDTLVLSRLFHPDRKGGHSLEAWGQRTGAKKTDFRQLCIDKGYIEKGAPKGAEFRKFVPEMVDYCRMDTEVGKNTFFALSKELKESPGNWKKAIRQEHKLADLGINRETLGFYFDDKLARWCFKDLTEKMEYLERKIEPNLPPVRLNKTEIGKFTPPKTQIKKDGDLGVHMINFADRVGAKILVKEGKEGKTYLLEFEGARHELPIESKPLKETRTATVKDSDHIKQTLINLHGWEPSEWRIRDMTVDSKKKKLPYEKRLKVYERWLKETVEGGKYTKHRLKIAFEDYKVKDIKALTLKIQERLKDDWPVRVPTSPPIKVGVTKELCPNLVKLGDKVNFAKDFADYLTYKDRRSNIAGGDNAEELVFAGKRPEKGYLSVYREEDNRISTPAIEVGTGSFRMKHIGVCNIPRVTSIYGKHMRALFGSGKDFLQFGFDLSGLEHRIQGHYILPYPGGKEEAKALIAEKPNDSHSLLAKKLFISRDSAKSIAYACLYGASPKKIGSMLDLEGQDAIDFYDNYWDAVPALKTLRNNITKFWETIGNKDFIPTIDGRLVKIRSKHSIINFLFQSSGVIFMKYLTVKIFQILEEEYGMNINPFLGDVTACETINYHDELQIAADPKLFKFKTFKTKEQAEKFIKDWPKEKGQLSDIGKAKKGYYIALPNKISKAINKAMVHTEKLLKIRVKMGYEWMVGKTWADTH